MDFDGRSARKAFVRLVEEPIICSQVEFGPAGSRPLLFLVEESARDDRQHLSTWDNTRGFSFKLEAHANRAVHVFLQAICWRPRPRWKIPRFPRLSVGKAMEQKSGNIITMEKKPKFIFNLRL